MKRYRDLDFFEESRDNAAFGVGLTEVPGLYGPVTGFKTSPDVEPPATRSAPGRARPS